MHYTGFTHKAAPSGKEKKKGRTLRVPPFYGGYQPPEIKPLTPNIAQTAQQCKPTALQKARIVKEYLLLHREMKPFTAPPQVLADGSVRLDFAPSFTKSDPSCILGVPEEFKHHHRRPMKARGPRKSTLEKYPALYTMAESGYVTDQVLLHTFARRLQERPLLFWESPEGEASVFWGMVKGSDQYNSYITDRINKCSSDLVKNYGFYYFLTFTYAYKLYGTDIVQAWKTFNTQLSQTFRALRDRFKMGYVCVLEATKKGYPHAHIILGVRQSVDKWHEKLVDGRRITCGRLFEFVRENVASPVFYIQKAGGIGLVKYLGKYVSKGAERTLSESLSKPDRLTSPARKALLSCLMPVLAGVRQYRFSIRDNVAPGVDWTEYSQEDYETLTDLVRLGWTSPEGDSILIRLLNKLTDRCHAHAWAVFDPRAKKALSVNLGWHSRAPPSMVEDFQAIGMPIGCPGCIVTSFLHNLQFPDQPPCAFPGAHYALAKCAARDSEQVPRRCSRSSSSGRRGVSGVVPSSLPASRGLRAGKGKGKGAGARGEERPSPEGSGPGAQSHSGAVSLSGLDAFQRWASAK